IVSTALWRHHATPPATSAATSFALPGSRASTPDEAKTIAGTTIAVTIATGTCLSARARSGGISRREKNAMNDRREAEVVAPNAKITSQIGRCLSMRALRFVADHPGKDAQQPCPADRKMQRHRVERYNGDRGYDENQKRNAIPQQWHQYCNEA